MAEPVTPVTPVTPKNRKTFFAANAGMKVQKVGSDYQKIL
jgi:hypothetical protein